MRRSLAKSISLVGAFLAWAAAPAAAADKPACAPGPLKLASFNVKFLGLDKTDRRDNEGLAGLLGDQDVVLVQELVSPPFAGKFPPDADGTAKPFRPDPQAASFFEAMRRRGFAWVEDTGPVERIHNNGSATEWWVAFYKPAAALPATDLPGGFPVADRSKHPDYDRVPYAFPFRTCSGALDFVLVSVHLNPDETRAGEERRRHEIASVAKWVAGQSKHRELDHGFGFKAADLAGEMKET